MYISYDNFDSISFDIYLSISCLRHFLDIFLLRFSSLQKSLKESLDDSKCQNLAFLLTNSMSLSHSVDDVLQEKAD